MAGAHIRALTAPPPIKPTSPSCPSAWQPNLGRRSTYRSGKTVQTTGATSGIAKRGRADACTRGGRRGVRSASEKISVASHVAGHTAAGNVGEEDRLHRSG